MKTTILSSLLLYEDSADGWMGYQESIYKIFCEDLRDGTLSYKDKPLKIRYQPIEFGKEEAFFHITCQDYNKDNERVPDFRRCERIKWVKQFIEAADTNSNVEFEGISYELKIWTENYKINLRYHIMCEELRFMVVLEERERYCLLITAFYFDHDHTLKKKLKKYEEYKAENAPQ